jgi:hypothetical protein
MNFLNVRYSHDDPTFYGLSSKEGSLAQDSRNVRLKLLSEGLKITPALFPNLSAALDGLGQSMHLSQQLDCFVVPDSNMQAWCVPHSSSEGDFFSVVLSSAIIEKLKPNEVRFVIGHEVGHYLCEHWRYPKEDDDDSLGDRLAVLSLSRSAEISADRIGMLACGSLEDACGAMIKTAAGLGEPHIHPDISSILSQFRELSQNDGQINAVWSTHPMIPHRIRALIRFEPLCQKLQRAEDPTADDLQYLDAAVGKDFDRISGNALKKISNKSLESVRVWGLVYLFIADGVISKAEQELLRQAIGHKKCEKVIDMLRSTTHEPGAIVMKKLLDACHQGRTAPLSERKLILSDFISLVNDAGLMDGHIEEALEKLEGMLIK